MNNRSCVLGVIVALCAGWARSSTEPQAASQPAAIFLKASKLLDVRTSRYIEQAGVWIEQGRIIDLHDATVGLLHRQIYWQAQPPVTNRILCKAAAFPGSHPGKEILLEYPKRFASEPQ